MDGLFGSDSDGLPATEIIRNEMEEMASRGSGESFQPSFDDSDKLSLLSKQERSPVPRGQKHRVPLKEMEALAPKKVRNYN